MAAIGIGLFAVQPLHAKDSIQLADFKAKLAQVSLIDLPLSASTLVSEASDKNRESVTVDAVRAAISRKSSVAPSVVGAIAHATPSMAVQAALTAASMEHKQLAQIVKAAAAAAPSEAGKIVAAFIHAYPARVADIAIAAGKGAPSAGREILTAVGDAAPMLQPSIKKVLDAEGPDTLVSVQAALTESVTIASQLPSLSAPRATSVAPTSGSGFASAPFTIITTLPVDQTSFYDPTANGGAGGYETTVSDPSYIQLLQNAATSHTEPPIVIGSSAQ